MAAVRGAAVRGSTATPLSAKSPMLPSLGTHFACGSECRATGALPPNVIGKSSPTTPPSWRARGGQPPAGAPAYILRRLMLDRMTVSAVARELLVPGRSAAALTTWLAAQTAIGAAAKP